MTNTKTILGLLLAGAISVAQAQVACHIHHTTQCSGDPYLICNNLEANVCCNAEGSAPSGALLNLPSGSSYSGYSPAYGNICGASYHIYTGAKNVCLNDASGYSGFAWFTSSAKMRRGEPQCKGKVEPDTLVDGHGVHHSLEGLTSSEIQEKWEQAIADFKTENNIIEEK